MKIKNSQAEALPSNLSVEELGRAMAAADFSSVPPEKRAGAIVDRLMGVMAMSIQDNGKALQIAQARINRSNALLG